MSGTPERHYRFYRHQKGEGRYQTVVCGPNDVSPYAFLRKTALRNYRRELFKSDQFYDQLITEGVQELRTLDNVADIAIARMNEELR